MNWTDRLMSLVPKGMRRHLRDSLKAIWQEDVQPQTSENFNRMHKRLTALEFALVGHPTDSRPELAPAGNGSPTAPQPAASGRNVYATPKTVTDISECLFYHAMDIPGYGQVGGDWDLRRTAHEYLGGVDFNGKRVLEIGTASGFLCFWMESHGAEVVAYDLSEDDCWDMIPYAGYDYRAKIAFYKAVVRGMNNAFWLSHRAFNSKARMVNGSVYAIPEEIGWVDIAVFGSVLLHLRDPFLALQNALRLTKETVVIAEPLPGDFSGPFMKFLPNPATLEPKETWWQLSPDVIQRFIGVLGFEDTEIHYHTQVYNYNAANAPMQYYTLVGRRTLSG